MRVLGYVYTSYGKRNVSAVRKDIQTYADWPTNSSDPNLAVRGIFFDETPQQYDSQTLKYLQGLTDFVKDLGPDQFVSSAILSRCIFTLQLIHCPYNTPPVSHHLGPIFLFLYFVLSGLALSFPSFTIPMSLSELHYGFIDFYPNTPYSTPYPSLHHNGFPFWDT